jgi:hypothetical protein
MCSTVHATSRIRTELVSPLARVDNRERLFAHLFRKVWDTPSPTYKSNSDVWKKPKHFAQTSLCLSTVRQAFVDTRNLTRRTIEIGIWSFDRRIPQFHVAARMPQPEENIREQTMINMHWKKGQRNIPNRKINRFPACGSYMSCAVVHRPSSEKKTELHVTKPQPTYLFHQCQKIFNQAPRSRLDFARRDSLA